jgi:plastocyanin
MACGGDEEQPSGPPVTVSASKPVEVVGGDYFFDPSSIVVEGSGGPLGIVLDNQGAVAHNLTLFDGEEEVGATPTFAGGEERSVTVELAPGGYRMVCTVADHEELGMVGDLEVR